jgi:murein DD-endopeptidase MepM/ murein hydrolase activator NlpD
MSSVIGSSRSCSRFRAVALVPVILSVAGCGADFTRFDDPFPRAQGAFTSVTRAGSAPDTTLIARPRAALKDGSRQAAALGRSSSAVGVPAPANRPSGTALRHDKPKAAFVKKSTVQKTADHRPANVTAGPRDQPAERAPKAISRTSVEAGATSATTTFHWPVQGKILVRFGSRRNGEKSGGISIAIQEGTPIEAAEDGVVIYADSGLKAFGNLVLMRHADNYVTVYAHMKELSVKRGDQVRRGNVIGAGGQTGNVATSQLYFEVRKDSTPIDPLRLLERRPDQARSAKGGGWPLIMVGRHLPLGRQIL